MGIQQTKENSTYVIKVSKSIIFVLIEERLSLMAWPKQLEPFKGPRSSQKLENPGQQRHAPAGLEASNLLCRKGLLVGALDAQDRP